MKQEDQKSIDRRLARIEGQVRGLRRQVESGSYCCDVLNQIGAVSSALNQVAAAVASQHVRHCIAGHADGDGHEVAKQMSQDDLFDELSEVFSKLMKA